MMTFFSEVLLWRKTGLPEREPSLMAVLLCLSECVSLSVVSDCSPQAPLSMGFPRQEYWRGLPCSPPGGSSQPRYKTQISHIVAGFFTIWATREPREWVAYPFSWGSSRLRHWTRLSCFTVDFFTSWATREAHDSFEFSEFVFYLSHFNWPQPPEGCVPSYWQLGTYRSLEGAVNRTVHLKVCGNRESWGLAPGASIKIAEPVHRRAFCWT